VSHAFFKRSLFICVGFIIGNSYSTQSSHIYSSQSVNSFSHFSWFYMTLINLASLPFVRGFFSKERGVIRTIMGGKIIYIIIIIIILRMTFSYAYRLISRAICFSKLVDRVNFVWLGVFLGSMLNVLFLLVLGYFWMINYWLIVSDEILTQTGLICLWFISFFVWRIILISIFYDITFFIKKKLIIVFLYLINQGWHLLYLPFIFLVQYNWKYISRLVLIVCFFFMIKWVVYGFI